MLTIGDLVIPITIPLWNGQYKVAKVLDINNCNQYLTIDYTKIIGTVQKVVSSPYNTKLPDHLFWMSMPGIDCRLMRLEDVEVVFTP